MYFRPRTPTQYWMEGILTPEQVARANGAHCPVPVFLLFDSRELFTRRGVQFTDGNMARAGQYRIGDSADFLRSIPFTSVYHDGSMYDLDADARREVIFRRNAEIVVENEMDLDTLKFIMCRTGSERDTLIELLGDAAGQWIDRIKICPPTTPMFYRGGMFVESARLVGDHVLIDVPPRGRNYSISVIVTDIETGAIIGTFADPAKAIPSHWRIRLPRNVESARLRVTIEGATAFLGVLTQQRIVGA
jgi:hypothetical protein